ncbi:MAG: ice-binding family protein [Patescibacteria group bacterium]
MKVFRIFSTLFLSLSLIVGSSSPVLAATAVSLGTAGSFAVLAGSGITDTNPSVIVGDAGSSPTFTNGLTGGEVTGTNYTAASAVVDLAKDDLVTAYDAAALQTPITISTELGGTIVNAGVYDSASGELAVTGTLTLDAEGNADAVFIFKAGSTLITASDSVVRLINGAQACNVFWQVTSSATLGTNSNFRGNLMALVSITDNGGSTVEGRLLARNGAVTLNNTHVTKANCATPVPPVVLSTSSRAGDSNVSQASDPVVAPVVAIAMPPIAVPLVAQAITTTYYPGIPSTGSDLDLIKIPLGLALILILAGSFLQTSIPSPYASEREL